MERFFFYFHSDWTHFCVCYELPCISDSRIVPLVWNHEVTKTCTPVYFLKFQNMFRAVGNTGQSTCCTTWNVWQNLRLGPRIPAAILSQIWMHKHFYCLEVTTLCSLCNATRSQVTMDCTLTIMSRNCYNN